MKKGKQSSTDNLFDQEENKQNHVKNFTSDIQMAKCTLEVHI